MENNNKQVKRLYRSTTSKVIFGVCGGLGEYFDIDPIIFRIVFLLMAFGGGSGLLIYLIMALLIPKHPTAGHHESEAINVKERVDELVTEFKDLKPQSKGESRGGLRLFLGLLVVVIGFGFLMQSLNLMPAFHMNFGFMFRFWPVLIILIGLSIFSRGTSLGKFVSVLVILAVIFVVGVFCLNFFQFQNGNFNWRQDRPYYNMMFRY